MLVGTTLTKISYVAVEVIRKNAVKVSDIDCGLYMGICCKKDTKGTEHNFLAVLTSKNSVRLYNMSEYNVVTIDLVSDSTRYMTIFTNEMLDQIEAAMLLKELTTALDTDGRLYANDVNKELINVETYVNWPASALEGGNLTQTKEDKAKDTSAAGNGVYSHTPYVAPVEKVPEVTVIRRKGKLPSQESLSAMKEKVLLLGQGQFTLKLSIPDCDKEKPKETKQSDVVGARHVAGFCTNLGGVSGI